MYFRTLASCLLVTGACVALAAPASAATLTIDGELRAGTCSLSAPAVTLPAMPANTLKEGDNSLVEVDLALTGCVGVKKATLTFDGTAAPNDGDRWENTGAAEGVSLSLLKEKTGTTYIKKGDTQVLTVAADTATFPMRAGYFYTKGSALAAGTVAASITITAAYE